MHEVKDRFWYLKIRIEQEHNTNWIDDWSDKECKTEYLLTLAHVAEKQVLFFLFFPFFLRSIMIFVK